MKTYNINILNTFADIFSFAQFDRRRAGWWSRGWSRGFVT